MAKGSLAGAPAKDFYRGKKVLVTGHTGFKGSWLALWLTSLGAKVSGISLPPDTKPNLFEGAGIARETDSHFCDIRDFEALNRVVRECNPDIILHLAAQALVRTSYADPVTTFATNVLGTAHILEAMRRLDKHAIAIIVTSDKVYENREWPYPYREPDRLGGHDPYSASKACAEIVAASYRLSFLREAGRQMATARAGNVIGGGDWSADRLLPDAVRAWSRDDRLIVRRPSALRPWQHVLDALAGYLVLAQRLWSDATLAEAWNFGPPGHAAVNVRAVVERAQAAFGRGLVEWGTTEEGPHEAGLLMLEPGKARQRLGVSSRWNVGEAVDRTMAWYRAALEGAHPRDLCFAEIADFEATTP